MPKDNYKTTYGTDNNAKEDGSKVLYNASRISESKARAWADTTAVLKKRIPGYKVSAPGGGGLGEDHAWKRTRGRGVD